MNFFSCKLADMTLTFHQTKLVKDPIFVIVIRTIISALAIFFGKGWHWCFAAHTCEGVIFPQNEIYQKSLEKEPGEFFPAFISKNKEKELRER